MGGRRRFWQSLPLLRDRRRASGRAGIHLRAVGRVNEGVAQRTEPDRDADECGMDNVAQRMREVKVAFNQAVLAAR